MALQHSIDIVQAIVVHKRIEVGSSDDIRFDLSRLMKNLSTGSHSRNNIVELCAWRQAFRWSEKYIGVITCTCPHAPG